MAQIKRDIFKHDPDHPVILHRKEIINKKGVFGVLRDPAICQIFDDRLIQFLTDTDYAVITAVIDKKAMMAKEYWSQKHPYHYLMEILVEKYTQWLERKSSTGDIMPEMRRGKKDQALQRAFFTVRTFGTYFVKPDRIAARLPAKHLKFRSKAENITGLQICDLIAHPSHIHVRALQKHPVTLGPFGARVVPILTATKYDRSYWGRISGYGIKYLP